MREDWEWAWHYEWGTSFMKWHSRGGYDITGVDAASPAWELSGADQDSSSYRVSYDWTYGGTPTTYDSVGDSNWDATYTNVVWSKDYDAHPYPLSGREHFHVHDVWQTVSNGEQTNDSYDGDVEITFNGTHLVPVVVDGRFTFTLDLDTGDVVEPGM